MSALSRTPGLPLKSAGGLPPIRSEALAHGGTAAEPLRAANVPSGIAQIIRPAAAQRWILPQLGAITPTYIESVLRGAFTGSHIQQWELFDLMEDTWPELAACAMELKTAVLRKPFIFEPYCEEDEEPTPEAAERQKLVSAALRSMRPRADADENGFKSLQFDILDAWLKGLSVQCVDWSDGDGQMNIIRAGKLGDVSAPRASFWVHPNNYAWDMNGRLGLRLPSERGRGVPTYNTAFQPSNTEVTPFPEHEFLIAICKAKSGPALTGARLRVLAWWWCAANFSADWLMNLAQIFGLPIRWANYATNSQQGTVDAVCNMLERMGSNSWAAFPEGTTLNLEQPGNIGDNSPQGDLLNRADVQARKIVLGQTMSGSNAASGAGNGAGAFGKQEGSVKDDIIEAAGDFVCNVINEQLIPSLLELNYADREQAPTMCFVEDEEFGSEQAAVVSTLGAAGLKFSTDEIYKKFGYRKPRQGEETIGGQPAAGPTVPGRAVAAAPPQSKPEDETETEALKASNGATSSSPSAPLAAKLHERLRPFLAVLRAAQKISDPVAQRECLEELLAIEPEVLAALRADPDIAKRGTLATAFSNALNKPEALMGFDPGQPRDGQGQWTDSTGQSSDMPFSDGKAWIDKGVRDANGNGDEVDRVWSKHGKIEWNSGEGTFPMIRWTQSNAAGGGRTLYLEGLAHAKTEGRRGLRTTSFAEGKAVHAWASLERREFVTRKETSSEDRGEDGVYKTYAMEITPAGEAFLKRRQGKAVRK